MIRHLFRFWFLSTILCGVGASSRLEAQEARYELGRRVRRFEQAWRPHDDLASRQAVSSHLNAAVSRFFQFRLPDAARALTDAELALPRATAPTEADRFVHSLYLLVNKRLIDPQAGAGEVRLDAFYDSGLKPPAGATFALSFVPARAGSVPIVLMPARALDRLPIAVPIEPGAARLPAGEGRLRATVRVSGRVVPGAPEVGVSVVQNLRPRLDAIAARLAAAPAETGGRLPSVEQATAQALFDLLDGLARGRVPETDYPAARLLDELEVLDPRRASGSAYHGPDRPGEFWLTLPVGPGRTATTRVFVPVEARPAAPRPLVVALHGAGGSENMFFDSYGAGAIVAACRERGWFLVAPRAGARVDQVVDVLATVYPIDKRRVYLVGHSMGAAMAVRAADDQPARYAALVALGGGGRVRGSDGLKSLPVFVGVGSDDFAAQGARALADAFRTAGAPTTFRAYPAVEHLGIVQVALPDVFKFFDRSGAPAR